MSELVRLRLRQAQETLADARALLDADRTPRSIINRAYYAMFYAVMALLQKVGRTSSKHAGAVAVFDKEFVHAGIFPKAMSLMLHQAFDERHESDDEAVKPTSRSEAEELLRKAESFVAQVAIYLEQSPAD